MKKMCGIVWAYAGPQEKAEETFKPIRDFKKAALDFVGPLPQPALQSMFDALYPPGLQWYWRADFVNELSDDAITQHIHFGEKLPTMHSTMQCIRSMAQQRALAKAILPGIIATPNGRR